MDKLIKYIETRIKKYGHAKGEQAISSNYYTFGDKVIRISDHMKYGLGSVKKFDYSFIIQPDDMYIFIRSPKNDKDSRMYLKITSLNEAKKFVRRLHDFSITLDEFNDVYQPEGWNRNNGSLSCDKPSWTDFCQTYFDGKGKQFKVNILDQIDLIVYGSMQKGTLDEKMERIEDTYEIMSITQYDTLINKIENKC